MFEDEEWNFNEDDFNSDDIFNDNNDKADNLVSTKSVETKKQSNVSLNTVGLQSNLSDNPQNNVTFQPNESVSISQKKVVLDIFNSDSHSQQVPKINERNSMLLDNEKPFKCTSNVTNERGKNLILNVFQANVEKSKPVVKSVLKIFEHENKLKRKKNVAFVDCLGESNVAKKVCTEKTNKSQESRKNDTCINQENHILPFEISDSSKDDISNYKKQTSVDLQKSLVHKSFKVPRVKQAVVRKFPGPAGILPDDVDENDVIELDFEDENKNNKSNQYADICSQNTKNLFSTGAWQLMMDDLPADFELYNIATIKENALQYSKTYKKVPYLAGIVQCIDYKPSDPHIILKDLTGRIDAHIHHSICKLYPNALGTNVVILAKNVGLIVTSKKFVCVIISLNNLVSIYSDEARLVETPHLKTLFENEYTNQNLDESQISVLDENECHDNNKISKTCSQEIENRFREQSGSKDKHNVDNEKDKETNSEGIPELNVSIKATDMHELDLGEDDSWLGVNIGELNSFNAHNFPSSTPLDSNEQNSSEVHFQIKQSKNVVSTRLQNTPQSENIVSGSKLPISTDKQKTISDKLSVFRNTTPESGKIVSGSKLPISTDKQKMISDKLSVFRNTTPESEKIASVSKLIISIDKQKAISDKLSIFRNTNDTSRSSTISKQSSLTEKIVPTISKPFEPDGNDTDDEMLSQLDVDAIAASYKTQNC